jgi:hypothetical protein
VVKKTAPLRFTLKVGQCKQKAPVKRILLFHVEIILVYILEGYGLKKAVRKKNTGYITFKIIRGTTENTRSVRLPKALIKTIFGLLAAYLVFVCLMTYRTGSLSFTYQKKLEEIQELETVNKTQQREITTLNAITAEVREKLKSLEDIEAKVKELVGIDE